MATITNLDFNIDSHFDSAGFTEARRELEALTADLRALDAQSFRIDVDLDDLSQAMADIEELRAMAERDIQLGVDVDNGDLIGIEAELDELTRDRTVNIDIDSDQLGHELVNITNHFNEASESSRSFGLAGTMAARIATIAMFAFAASLVVLPGLIGLVGAALSVGLVGAVIAAGAVILHNNEEIKASFNDLKNTLGPIFKEAAAPMKDEFVGALNMIKDRLVDVKGLLHDTFAAAAPLIQPLTAGLLDLGLNALPGMNDMLRASGPLVDGLAQGMANFGYQMSVMWTGMSAGAAGFGQILNSTFTQLGVMMANFGIAAGQMADSAAKMWEGLLVGFNNLLKGFLDGLVGFTNTAGPSIGKLAEVFGAQFGEAFRVLMPVLGEFVLLLSDSLVPILEDLVPPVTEFIRSAMVGLLPALKGLMPIIIAVADGLGTMIKWLGPAAPILVGVAAAIWLVNAALAVNPFVLLGIAIAAVVAGIVYLATKTQFFQNIWAEMKAFVAPIWQWITDTWHRIMADLTTTWNQIKAISTAVWDAMKLAWTTTINAIKSVWDSISHALTAAWNGMWNNVKAVAEGIWFGLRAAAAVFITALIVVFDHTLKPLAVAWSALWNGIKAAAGAIWDWMKAQWDQFVHFVKTVWDAVSGPLSAAWNAIWNAIKNAANQVWDFLKAQWQAFLNILRTAWDAYSSAFQAVWNTVWNAVKNTAEGVWNLLKSAWTAVWNFFTSTWNSWKDFFTGSWNSVWDGVKSTAQTVWNWLKQTFNEIKDGICQTIQDLVDKVKGIWDNIINIFRGPVDEVKGIWNTVAEPFGLPKFATGGPVEAKAYGGPIDGAGGPREDNVPIWASAGEHMLTADDVAAAGGHDAIFAFRRSLHSRIGDRSQDNSFAAGGVVDRLDAAKSMAREKGDGRGYVYGGTGPDGFDCSGYMSAIYNVLTGAANWWSRSFSTESDFDSLGFQSGMNSRFAVGIMRGGGGPNSHMAGTLDGVNVESGGGHNSTRYGGPAAGADHGQFPIKYFLPEIGGQFVSGGGGGGAGGGPSPEQIKMHDDAVAGIKRVISETLVTTASMIGEANRFAANQQTPGFVGPVGVMETHSAAANEYLKNKYGVYAPAGDVHGAGTEKSGSGAIARLDEKLASMHGSGGPIGGEIPGGERFKLIADALGLTNTPPPSTGDAWQRGMNTLIERESGWNAGAVNNTDSNAAAGTPSKGLTQMIDTTFNAHAVPGHNNIFAALDNIASSINYIKSEYGSIENVQQANANMEPKGYSGGTGNAPEGWSLVGENGPEMVKFRGGETIKSFNDIVGALKDSAVGTGQELSTKMGNEFRASVDRLLHANITTSDQLKAAVTAELQRLGETFKTEGMAAAQHMGMSVGDAIERLFAEAGIKMDIQVTGANAQEAQRVVDELKAEFIPQLDMFLKQHVGAV